MSTSDLYDPKTVSSMLEIPSSTLRRYCQLFPEYFSETAKVPSKKRRYTNTDVITLKKIKELTRSRKTENEIRSALQIIQDQPPEPENQVNALALLPQIAAEFEQLRINQATTQTTIDQLQKRLDQLEKEAAERRLPWYKRIRKR